MSSMTAKSSQSGRKKAKVEGYASYLLRLSQIILITETFHSGVRSHPCQQ